MSWVGITRLTPGSSSMWAASTIKTWVGSYSRIWLVKLSGTVPPTWTPYVREDAYLTPGRAHQKLETACQRPGGFYSVLIEIVAEVFGLKSLQPLLDKRLKRRDEPETEISHGTLADILEESLWGGPDDGVRSALIDLGRRDFRKALADLVLDSLEHDNMREKATHILTNILWDGRYDSHDRYQSRLHSGLTGSDENLRRIGLRAAREAAEARGSLGEDRDA